MIRKLILFLITVALLPMCSTKSPEEKQEPAVEKAAPMHAAKPIEKKAERAVEVNGDWAKDIDELVEKTAGLAALADITKCEEGHDAMVSYMATHRTRLELLANTTRKLGHTVPAEDKVALEKKMAADFDPSIAASIASMSMFAKECCNKKLDREKALKLDKSLQFIVTLKSFPSQTPK